MHSFFTKQATALQGVTKFPEWQYVRDGLRRNLGTTLSYYRKNPTAVKSNHLLVRLLQSITVPQSQHLLRYYDNVDAIALNLSMALKMTSSIYRGEVFQGVFYDEDSTEILIAHNEYFDIHEAHRNWMNLAPVQVLRHPRSDLGLGILDGADHGIESGLAVISINVTMLAVQYRAFRLNEQTLTGDNDTQRSVMQFVRMYVLPNMLPSHLDMALFNRIDHLLRGAPLGVSKTHHSFALVDHSRRVDEGLGQALAHFAKSHKDLATTLRTIPAAYRNDMEQACLVPDLPATQQVYWALTVSRLPQLGFLADVSRDGVDTRDRSTVNQILRSVLALRTNNIFRKMLPVSEYLQVEMEIDRFVNQTNQGKP